MAYVLVSCKSLYTDIVYRVYNLKTSKHEQVNYDKLLYLMYSEGFTNLSFDADMNIVGLKRYLDYTNKHSYVCVKRKDKIYTLVDEYGDFFDITEEELRKIPVKERVKYLNLSFGTKRVKCTDKAPKVFKLKREDVKFYINQVYIAYMEEDDELVLLVNSGYCDKYNMSMKVSRIAQKFYGVRSAEIEFDGVADNLFVGLLCGNKGYEVCEDTLRNYVHNYLAEEYINISQWDETNKVYCLPFEVSDSVKKNLYDIIIKNS